MKIIYLCHPYSHTDPAVMRERFENANRIAGILMKEGYVVFSPLSHSVPIAEHLGNHLSHDFWLKQDLPFVALCHELWVPLVSGWDTSKGIAIEIAEARRLGKPVIDFEVSEWAIGGTVINIKRCVHPDDKNGRCPGLLPG